MCIVIYINSRLNKYFPNSRKINKESAEAVVKYIRKKSGTDKDISLIKEPEECSDSVLVRRNKFSHTKREN